MTFFFPSNIFLGVAKQHVFGRKKIGYLATSWTKPANS
jgi:hypothetical protein